MENTKIDNASGVVFKTLKMRNFMSFGNIWAEVDLQEPGTTFVVGENLDSGGSSGAGKTTLISAIAYCLYDKIPSSVSKDHLINRTNEKKNTTMEVILSFEQGTDTYSVRRYRGASTGVQLFLNDKDITPDSVANFNDRIEEIVGFSYNLFSQIILFSGNSKPFLDLSVGEQRTLIEELFKITTLSKKANALKTKIKDTEKSIDMQKLLIQQQIKQNDAHRKHVQEARERVSRWITTNANDILVAQQSLENSAKIDFEFQEQVFPELTRLESEIAVLAGVVKGIDVEINAKQKEQAPGKTKLVLTNSDLSKKKSELAKILAELAHLKEAKCPYCLQKYEDAAAKISESEAKEVELSGAIKTLTSEAETLEIDNASFEVDQAVELETLKQKKVDAHVKYQELSFDLSSIKASLSFPNLNALITAKNAISVLQDKIVRLQGETNPHVEALAEMEAEGEIIPDNAKLDESLKLLEHQQFLLKLLTDKNSFIRKNIISKTIPFLNKRIAYYTEKLNLPHIVLFQPDMSCEITEYGRSLSHGNLSNGEKKKLNLSLCLAFRDVLTYLHSKVNVLFTDEVDGGSISGLDVDSLITMIKHKAWDDDISIFIISHRPEFDGRCDRNIVVRKEGGFSSLILHPDS